MVARAPASCPGMSAIRRARNRAASISPGSTAGARSPIDERDAAQPALHGVVQHPNDDPTAPCRALRNREPLSITLEALPVDEHLRAIVGVDIERSLRRDREVFRVPERRIRTRHAVRKRDRLADRRHLRSVGYQLFVRLANGKLPRVRRFGGGLPPGRRRSSGRTSSKEEGPPETRTSSTTSSTYVTTTPSQTGNDRDGRSRHAAVAESSLALHSGRVPSPQLVMWRSTVTNRLLLPCSMVLALMCVPASAPAQSTYGAVVGVVTDSSGGDSARRDRDADRSADDAGARAGHGGDGRLRVPESDAGPLSRGRRARGLSEVHDRAVPRRGAARPSASSAALAVGGLTEAVDGPERRAAHQHRDPDRVVGDVATASCRNCRSRSARRTPRRSWPSR